MKRRSFLKTVLGVGVGLVGASARHSVPLRNIGISDDSLVCGNVGIGRRALYDNTSGNRNIAVGYSALTNNTTGNSNELAFGNEFHGDVDFDH